MAYLQKAIGLELLNQILPSYGNHCELKSPVWNEAQKMFITNEYESEKGFRYYNGIRFSNNLVIVEKIGLAYSWTFLDGLELYRFEGQKLHLIQKKEYNKTTYRNDDLVLSETKAMLHDYLRSTLKISRAPLPEDVLLEEVNKTINACYKSFLDSDFNVKLTCIVKELEANRPLSLPIMHNKTELINKKAHK